ncbi:MAG: hypothetical protein Q4F30_03215 [Akkermansia sp.]|nr:hypothetical protein [Akkermansia sp.]
MKLHLPSSLRKALLAVMAFAAVNAQAEIMHNSVSLLTYTDFGSNMGRYSIYQQNALLQHLNEGGVYITYTQGEAPYELKHGMISFESAVDGGPFTAIGYNATATVQHNGVTNPVFTGRFIGSGNSVHYAGIEYRSCTDNKFLLTPEIDYKITRLSKIVTDITPTSVFDTRSYLESGGKVEGMLQYHMGGGYQQRADAEGNTTWLREAYVYVTAGILENTGFNYNTGFDYKTGEGTRKDGRDIVDDSYTVSMTGVKNGNGWGPGTAGTESHPMPFVTQGGDSGSPVWVWNESSKSYELISCHQARGGTNSYSRGASEWTKQTLESFCVTVNMDEDANTVHLGKVQLTADSKRITATANGSTPVETTLKYGAVLDGSGRQITKFVGVENGVNTWCNLGKLKDGQVLNDKQQLVNTNWYAYGNEYLNANNTSGLDLQYADLFETQNLVFKSAGKENNSIILDADVDLGIGYAEFTNTADSGTATFTITSKEKVDGRDYNFNHAGYIVDAGTEVHLKIANTEIEACTNTTYFREWRKTGEGDLYLEGTGNNEIFLNVGGKGTTYLKETGGYAAYNVLINNGATVNLGGKADQVKRDVTFGYGGGTLDFAGDVTMDWYTTTPGAPKETGFTMSALTQDAVIANTTGTTRLTYRSTANSTFLGSFQDGNGSGVLQVAYAGASDSTWTLNSIHTKMDNAASGLTVQSGTVKLAGTLTEHAQGSLNGYNQQRYSNEDDWHYADAKMNVTVDRGATFELGSHARLDGRVTVQDNATFVMREGVRHQYEYIEGWYELENTYDIAEYYGLKGGVALEGAGSRMVVEFSENTDANTTYAENITGSGSMIVDTAKGSLTLMGTNSFSGTKELTKGALILGGKDSAGDVTSNKWQVGKQAWLAVGSASAATALEVVDTKSTGVLALTQNEDGDALDTNTHRNLIIGAKEGETIQYGREGTDLQLAAVDNQWKLGGGGGTLVVNYVLNGGQDSTLVLGNEYTTGAVKLTNTGNHIGNINFMGKVTLEYDDTAALGQATVNLAYTNRLMGIEGAVELVSTDSQGVLLLDKMEDATVNLAKHADLALGVEGTVDFRGHIDLGQNYTYNLGGVTGSLVMHNALEDQGEGGTNLMVDAQTYTGGVVELKKALGITGSVVVAGHYLAEEDASGSITLKVDEDNSFDRIDNIWLFDGGILDINGTRQELKSYTADQGSSIVDSSADKSGVLHLKGEAGINALEGMVDVGTIEVDCSHMTLGGTNTYHSLNIMRGEVALGSGTALCATGKTTVGDTATLYVDNQNVTADIELHEATIHIGVDNKSGTLGGALAVAGGKTGTIVFDADATISAVISGAENSRLSLQGNRVGTFSSGSINEEGGSLDVELRELRLQGSGGITIGGTVDLKGQGGNLRLTSHGARDNTTREISHLNLNSLNLTLWEESWNTIWNLHKLTGDGSITWDSHTTHWYSARLVLDGENTFTGSLIAKRTYDADQSRTYSSYLELAHDKAAQNMDVELIGRNDKNRMTLAVNTENAAMRSLKGDALTAIYAGVSVEGSGNSGAASTLFQATPQSTRHATLTITGESDATFSGCVYNGGAEDENGYGLDLVMAGSNRQTFNGSTVQFNNVAVEQGTLVLDSAGLSIADTATISRGATLQTGGHAFELRDKMTLQVCGDSTLGSATLGSTLQLAGGSLLFDASSLNDADYALKVGGVNVNDQDSLVVSFESTTALRTDFSYKLVSGDWSALTAYEATGLDYYTAKFDTDGGLNVTFSLKGDYNVWEGDVENRIWSSTVFGRAGQPVPGGEQTAVFNDLSTGRDVLVQGEVSVGKLLFDSTGEYTLRGESDAAKLTAGSLQHKGSGQTTIGSGVEITGMAEVQTGTLVMEQGSSTAAATVAQDATLKLVGTDTVGGQVSGDGTLAIAWGEGGEGSVAIGSIGTLDVQSGTLAVDSTLDVKQAALVKEDATLRTSTGTILLQADMSLQLAGTLQIDTESGSMDLNTTVTMLGETGGTVKKTGSGTLAVKSSIVADSLVVEQGRLNITQAAVLGDFLANTQNLEVKNGGYAYLGGDAYTLASNDYVTSLSVDGTGSILHLGLGQNSTKTFQGGLSVTNGGKVELHDGGLQINGSIRFGASANDQVTLWGNWGEESNPSKAGFILAGKVDGAGTVALQKGGSGGMERFTLSNGENTFEGTYRVDNRAALVVAADKAIDKASVNLNGGSLVLGTGNISMQSLQGNSSGTVKLLSGVESATLTVNQTTDGVYAGSIGSGISLVKQGDKTLGLGNANSDFNGSVAVKSGTLALDATATGMLANAAGLTVDGGATLQTGAGVTLTHDATINGTLALGGTMGTTAKLTVAGTANIILGGSYETPSSGTRVYDVFTTADSGSVSGWSELTDTSFSGFGSAERGATITKLTAPTNGVYQVQVSTDNIKAMEITWSKDVAVGTWDSDNANFTENGERTAYYAGDTVTIESDANITMGTTVNLHATEQHATAGTLNVQGGANATVNQTAGNTLNMDVLHVKEGSHLVMTTEAGNFAEEAIVDGNSTLEVRISSNSRSGTVGSVSGEGTLQIANTGTLNIDDGSSNRLSGGSIDASEFRGTLALGNGSSQLRFHSTNLSGLAGDAVIEVNRGAQYWAGGNDRTLDNDIIIHASNAGSGTKDGFGSVRDVTTFNGNVSIDGNAMVSGLGGRNNECDSITFNAAISGVNDNDTLTFGNGYGSSHAMTFTLTENANATNLANMVVAKSGGSKTTVNVDSGDGLAENLKFAANVGGNAEVNLNGGGTLQRLESRAGDGVVNLADGKSLKIAGGADFGGTVNVADAVTLTTMDREDGAAHVEGSVSYSVNGRDASISSETGSRMENISIDLKEATRLQMQNITLSANSRITDAAATLVADGLGLEANVGTNLKPLTYADAKAPAMVQQSADKVVSFTLENVQDVSIEGMGSGLFITLVGDSANILAGADWLELGLGTDAVFTDNLAVTLQFIDSAGMQQSVEGTYTMETVAALAAAGTTYDRVYFNVTGAVENSNVPEPASSTLSLLALAALAARRRRRK